MKAGTGGGAADSEPEVTDMHGGCDCAAAATEAEGEADASEGAASTQPGGDACDDDNADDALGDEDQRRPNTRVASKPATPQPNAQKSIIDDWLH